MKLNKDNITTVAGLLGAMAGTLAPLLTGTAQQIAASISAVSLAVVGYFTGKSPTGGKIS